MENLDYVRMQDITKSFGTVQANNTVDFSVCKGEIHAILGENGSGKSTLMNVLSGIYVPDSGSITIGGRHVKIRSPKEAIDLGIGMIHQHFKLVEVLSAAQNIIGGRPGGFFIQKKSVHNEIKALCARYGFHIDPDKMTYTMSIGEKQTVEILKALYRGANVLILDEPTAVLTPQETDKLFSILRNMRDEGCAIIIITHKLSEVMEISDRVTVLCKGKSVVTVNTAETTPAELTEKMVGHAIDLNIVRAAIKDGTQQTMVEIRDLTVCGDDGHLRLDHVNFSMNSYEVFGIAGIAGSGQKELCEAITGLQSAVCGSIRFNGHELLGMKPREIIRRGVSMSFVPEDRLGMGLVGGLSIEDNVVLKSYRSCKGIFMDRRYSRAKAKQIVKDYNVSTPGIHQVVQRLSGGNIQKVLLGREIDQNPAFLITAYPVRGLDIGASYFIYDRLNEQKQKGVAVLFIGEDLDVLMALCDRIGVLHGGRMMGVVDAKTTTKEQLGLMMMGREKGDLNA
jgi:simple sugar transport system ATP-binding protein